MRIDWWVEGARKRSAYHHNPTVTFLLCNRVLCRFQDLGMIYNVDTAKHWVFGAKTVVHYIMSQCVLPSVGRLVMTRGVPTRWSRVQSSVWGVFCSATWDRLTRYMCTPCYKRTKWGEGLRLHKNVCTHITISTDIQCMKKYFCGCTWFCIWSPGKSQIKMFPVPSLLLPLVDFQHYCVYNYWGGWV